MLPPFFSKLPRGMKLVMIGMVVWLVGIAPLAVYLLLVRLSGDEGAGPGFAGAVGFALNVVAVGLVIGGAITWLRDERSPPSTTGEK